MLNHWEYQLDCNEDIDSATEDEDEEGPSTTSDLARRPSTSSRGTNIRDSSPFSDSSSSPSLDPTTTLSTVSSSAIQPLGPSRSLNAVATTHLSSDNSDREEGSSAEPRKRGREEDYVCEDEPKRRKLTIKVPPLCAPPVRPSVLEDEDDTTEKTLCRIVGCTEEIDPSDEITMRSHVRTHYPSNLPLTCLYPGCPQPRKVYFDLGSLVRHIATKHHRAQRPICPECGKDFSRADAVRRHAQKVHGKA